MATPYRNVAKAALMSWPPYYSEEEAEKKIQTESIQELESHVGAISSVKYAVIGIAKQIGFTEEETTKFFEAVVNGPEDAEIFGLVREKVKGFSEEKILEVLSTIHDGWIVENSSEDKFKKKAADKKLRQYAPLDLIGWNEVKNDLLFLVPILTAVGVQVNEETLSQAYHARVAGYMEKMKISKQSDLTALVQQGKKYYPILPEELEKRLLPMSEDVSEQIIQNWTAKDQETLQIFTTGRPMPTGGRKQ